MSCNTLCIKDQVASAAHINRLEILRRRSQHDDRFARHEEYQIPNGDGLGDDHSELGNSQHMN